jgi:hypothetical protein
MAAPLKGAGGTAEAVDNVLAVLGRDSALVEAKAAFIMFDPSTYIY